MFRRAFRCLSSSLEPFHLAIPVKSVPEARKFYGGVLGLVEGRRDGDVWQDYNFFGHQLVCHRVESHTPATPAATPANGTHPVAGSNSVDAKDVPVPHFGVCLTVPQFQALAAQLKEKKIKFIIEPYLRFQGTPGEQWTMFFEDHVGNYLEFKAMTNPANLFAVLDMGKATPTPTTATANTGAPTSDSPSAKPAKEDSGRSKAPAKKGKKFKKAGSKPQNKKPQSKSKPVRKGSSKKK